MKRVIISVIVSGSAILLSSCATKNTPQTGTLAETVSPPPVSAPTPGVIGAAWPVAFASGTSTYTVFEPQTDWWDGHQVLARSAVAVQSGGQAQPAYGVLTFSAITLPDKATQTAKLAEVKITSAHFPSAPSRTADYLTALSQQFPLRAKTMDLDRLEGSLTLPPRAVTGEVLNNTPPRIIIATRPAVLVYVDGPPVWRPVPGTGLMHVINTRMVLLKDQSGQCYLRLFDRYLQAPSLEVPGCRPANRRPAPKRPKSSPSIPARPTSRRKARRKPARKRPR